MTSHLRAVFFMNVHLVFSRYLFGKHSARKVWLPLSVCIFVNIFSSSQTEGLIREQAITTIVMVPTI